ncbi:MAG: discoidin domain-containing protein [Desulfonauticus sp.]|nr:discoidin domain-containing protein [Desulfonauticus sp.]
MEKFVQKVSFKLLQLGYKSIQFLFYLNIFIVFFIISRGISYAKDSIKSSAQLSYNLTETKAGGKKESSQQVIQRYNLGLIKSITPKLTFFSDLSVFVKEENDEKSTFVSPNLRLNVNNEYFDGSTGYRLTEKEIEIFGIKPNKDRYTNEFWNMKLTTKIKKYPKLKLNYSEAKSYDHLDEHQTNNKRKEFSLDLDYGWSFLNFNYGYRKDIVNNYVTESKQMTDTNKGGIAFHKTFKNKQITTSGSYVFTHTKIKTTTQGEDVSVEEMQRSYGGLYEKDTTPDTGSLNTYSSLVDGNKVTSTGIDIGGGSAGTYQNIGLDLNSPIEIEQIRVYVSSSSSFDAGSFNWSVYYSNDNLNWTLIINTADFTYDPDKNMFEISFTKTKARYFKVVDINNDIIPGIYVTEIEAYSKTVYPAFSTTIEETLSQKIQFSLGYKLTDWCRLHYSFLQNQKQTKPDGKRNSSQSHFFTARVKKDINKHLLSWAEYRRSWKIETDIPDIVTDTYLVHFRFIPIKQLASDLSLKYSELKEDYKLNSRTTTVLLKTQANIREGIDLNVSGKVTHLDKMENESVTDTQFIDSTLWVKLTRTLTSEFTYNRQWTITRSSTSKTKGDTSSTMITLYWRPSGEFNLRATYGINRDELKGTQTTQQKYSLNWFISKKVQTNMNYSIDKGDSLRYKYSFNLSWNLSRTFSLSCSYDWTRIEAEEVAEIQSLNTVLSARF